ncbi:MAG: PD40 domain-containing protein [Saprospiraceae bacterium]|nr:PD40 domain-containing protein [Saprospiraceae bacterium]
MKKKVFFIWALAIICTPSYGQISARLMRYLDVSDSHITFVYGGDIWVMAKSGGTAIQITHSPGEESWPKFSPDGKTIGYSASYNGNQDVYTVPVTGGVPTRVTYQSHADRMLCWHPDGRQILFASRRELGQRSSNQFFLVSKSGGLPIKLAIPYGELASFSPDGNNLAYITKISENYPFKRYRGGLASDIFIFNLKTNTAENITNSDAIDGKPSWSGERIYFLSDRDDNMRLNVWSYDTRTKKSEQLTKFKDFDIMYMSAGSKDLVFEAGGALYLLDLKSQKYKEVPVNIVSDLSLELPQAKDVSRSITNMTASPEGKRIVFEARGELFNVPVTEGYTLNLTSSSGSFDRNPSWSPNGKQIAYWSDQSGEFEIYLQSPDKEWPLRKLTNRNIGFGYNLNWSPDSKRIAFIDEKNNISIVDSAGTIVLVDHTVLNIPHSAKFNYTLAWSPDSKWLAYTKAMENNHFAIMAYEVDTKTKHQVTSGFYNDDTPEFSVDGKYLFYTTNREMAAVYSDLNDGTWVYPNSTMVAALSLRKDVPSLLAPKNDLFDEKKPPKDTNKLEVKIDFDHIESRIAILPIIAGNIGGLAAFEGKLVYFRTPNSGSGDNSNSLNVYDLIKKEDKLVMADINQVSLTADRKAILVNSKGAYGIIKPDPAQKIEKPIPTKGLSMNWIAKEEWKQIFNDTWRLHRDFFYDPAMQQVDWNEMKKRYGPMINDARTRWDVLNIQSQLVSELSAGHTYSSGGDLEDVTPRVTGFLGIDWELNNNMYRIKRIVYPAAWDTDVRSPFDRPGVDVQSGDYILSVNGQTIQPMLDPYAAFEGLSGQTVSLMISRTGKSEDAKQVVVKCLTQNEESNLRYLEWLEQNRKMVDKLSNGQLGYVYMSNTSAQGQMELVKMYYGQLDKKGFIIDERFNGGGQLADRFLEILTKPVVYNLHWRHGRDLTQPLETNPGPKGMLINGWAGSGGDGLPWAFKVLKAGPIVGERTLGILVGPATGHRLIDGGSITVPDARLYDNAGHWFWEGEGVSPDIKVTDDPNLLVKGRDPQIERVVEEVMKLVQTKPFKMTPAPKPDDRTAKGLKKN